jgi:hypothetical protein
MFLNRLADDRATAVTADLERAVVLREAFTEPYGSRGEGAAEQEVRELVVETGPIALPSDASRFSVM